MSETSDDAGSPRQPGGPGVHSLDHFVLSIPDIGEAREFFEAFGLNVRPEGRFLSLRTFGSSHRWALLMKGPAKRLNHLSFGIFDEDLAHFRAHILKAGLRPQDPPPGFESDGLWITDPDGIPVELRVTHKTSPDKKSPSEILSSPPGTRGTTSRQAAPRTQPTRLAHCLLFTANVPAAITFYCDVLGLRLSDRSGDGIAFLHGIHGSDHHLIAFVGSSGPGLHHSSWTVSSVDEIGLGAAQMAASGYRSGWGLGRHVLGSNYFHYVRDPWGSYAEYSCDMDYIPAGHAWLAGDHDPEDAFYIWGPTPPTEFTQNCEADSRGSAG